MSMDLITTNTITSGTASATFTSSIDDTYKLYIFKFIDVHPATDGYPLRFYGSSDGNSSFVNQCSVTWYAYTPESGTPSLTYHANGDKHAGSPTDLAYTIGNDADQSLAGELWLFDPSNTTYVTHWYSRTTANGNSDESFDLFSGGYFQTASAINAVKFDMGSGNIDAAVIKMYGVG